MGGISDWLADQIRLVLEGDITALFTLMQAFNLSWLGFKGFVLAIQAAKIAFKDITRAYDGRRAGAQIRRMDTITANLHQMLKDLGLLEAKKFGIATAIGKTTSMVKTNVQQAITG